MPQIDFYILGANGQDDEMRFGCRLAEKAWRLRHSVHIETDDERTAARLDELLWTFRDGAFVPHERLRDASGHAPITIGCDEGRPHHSDVLINFSSTVPPIAAQFDRVAEIVGPDAGRRRASRQRYAEYRDRGYALETHDLTAGR